MNEIVRTLEGALYPNEYSWFPKRNNTKNIDDENKIYLFETIDKVLEQPKSKRMFDELWKVSSEVLVSSGEIQTIFPFRRVLCNSSNQGSEIYVAKHTGSLMGSQLSISRMLQDSQVHISLVKLFGMAAYTGVQYSGESQTQHFHNKLLKAYFS